MNKVYKIYCIHHSHFDLGYTHPQDLILELQEDYISQALQLCEKYQNEEKPFRWTIEATLPLQKWLSDATKKEIDRMKKMVMKNLISICALPMHTTSLNDAFQIKKGLETKKEIETLLDTNITTAINHDINGQPWSFSDLLIDAGIDFYLTGENIHFGGIPFPRPVEFLWGTPSKKELLCFLGEHYSLFSQFFNTDKRDVHAIYDGVNKYLNHLDSKGYNKDYIVLTATNPPLLDNNSPDFGLYDLIKEFNKVHKEFEIEMITPEMLKDILKKNKIDKKVSGDWTDFWNFGAGSTPLEVKYNKIANQNIKKALLFDSLLPETTNQIRRVMKDAIDKSLLYNEHTWGAANSITEPDSLQAVMGKSQKQNYCFEALSKSAFALNKVQDDFHKNSVQIEELSSMIYTNTSSFLQKINTKVPCWLLENKPYLSSFKSNIYLHESYETEEDLMYGPEIELFPYQTISVPIEKFKKPNLLYQSVEDGIMENDIYRIYFDSKTGSIYSIENKRNKFQISKTDTMGIFDYVLETINEEHNSAERSTFFPRDIELANYSVSVWNHDWVGSRDILNEEAQIELFQLNNETILKQRVEVHNEFVEWIERRVVITNESDEIKVKIKVKRQHTTKPNAQYISIPTNLGVGWQSIFESANTLCQLDEDQIGSVSKDWLTIGNSIAFFDDSKGFYLATSDTPLIQINGFSFGRESKQIERNQDPLFLPWLYNNYWDTNFSASDDNKLEYDFILKPFDTYKKEEQVSLGSKVSRPVELTWGRGQVNTSIDIPIETKNIEILSIEKEEAEIKVFVKNFTDEIGSVDLINNDSYELFQTDLYGKKQSDSGINFSVSANSFGYFILHKNVNYIQN